MKKSAFDLRHPFFRPVWRRVLVVAICFAWASVEYSNGAEIWAMIFAALGGAAAWQFFIDWKDPDDGDGDGGTDA